VPLACSDACTDWLPEYEPPPPYMPWLWLPPWLLRALIWALRW